MAVSPGNKKICSKCGADVTFARRVSDPKGRYLCLICAKTTTAKAPVAPEDDLDLLAQLEPAAQAPARTVAVAKPPTVQPKKEKRPASRLTEAIPWIAGAIAIVAILIAAIFLVNRKTWDEQNRQQILSMKADADALLRSANPKAAYDRYKDLFTFVDGHEIQNDFLKTELESAHSCMDTAYAQAAPLIEKEEAEERQRAAEQQRLADQRRADELAQKQRDQAVRQQQEAERAKAEAQAREQERISRAAAAQRALKATARALFLKSDEFARWKRQADTIVSDLNTDMIGEDSAYRGLSKRSKASRNLMGLYVMAEGHLLGADVDNSVKRILSSADSDLITEDSAIRAIYENDKAFFQVLQPLCVVIDGRNTSLQSIFDDQSRTATLAGIGDDSAVRAIDSYSDAGMRVLRAIVSAQGMGTKADNIISDVSTGNIGEDSAWRSAMRNEQGSMRLLLLMVASEDPATAASIGRTADTGTIGDDSALRAQEAYLQGKIEALHWLVGHP